MGPGVGVTVLLGPGVGVAVFVGYGVGVAVFIGVGVGVFVGLGVGVIVFYSIFKVRASAVQRTFYFVLAAKCSLIIRYEFD